MSHNNIEIKEGAFLISDAHYSYLRPELLDFIKSIHSNKLQPTQLILMGDIFDALFGGIDYTQERNAEIILLLQEISNSLEVIFFEGNHDFNLHVVFPNMKIIKIDQQPLLCRYKDDRVYLAHGDFDGTIGYKIYTSIVRNWITLYFLNHLNNLTNHYISKKLDSYLSIKNDCKEFVGFEEHMQHRLSSKFTCSYFIEGHYHQNRSFDIDNFRYINLAAFACNQRYFIVKSLEDKELLEEKIL